MINTIPIILPNIKSLTWNYAEAGYGKGPMDAVGGVLKHSADNLVKPVKTLQAKLCQVLYIMMP